MVEKHQPEETYYDFYISLSVMIWFLSANYSKIDGLKPPTSLWACYQQRSSRNLRLFTATVLVIYGISSVLDLEVIEIYPKIAISMRQMMTQWDLLGYPVGYISSIYAGNIYVYIHLPNKDNNTNQNNDIIYIYITSWLMMHNDDCD